MHRDGQREGHLRRYLHAQRRTEGGSPQTVRTCTETDRGRVISDGTDMHRDGQREGHLRQTVGTQIRTEGGSSRTVRTCTETDGGDFSSALTAAGTGPQEERWYSDELRREVARLRALVDANQTEAGDSGASSSQPAQVSHSVVPGTPPQPALCQSLINPRAAGGGEGAYIIASFTFCVISPKPDKI